MAPTSQRAVILGLLALTLIGTRSHHFSIIPDASWALFFIGGFYLRSWSRWAFPALMVLAVLVDWVVISTQGIPFWSHYCVSPAYGCLIAAYLVLWAGGAWLRRPYKAVHWRPLLKRLIVALTASVALCHLIAQGSFYWTSAMVPTPSIGGWLANYWTWLPLFLAVTGLYVGLTALIHASILLAAKLRRNAFETRNWHY